MKVKCENCGLIYDASSEKCPECGEHIREQNMISDSVPDSLESLQKFVRDNNIDLKKLKLYINEDTKQIGAYGMIKDEYGDFTFYRNRSDGTRSVRYKGNNEAFAVNEFYRILIAVRSEVDIKPEDILNRPVLPEGKQSKYPLRRVVIITAGILVVLGIFIVFLSTLFSALHPDSKKVTPGYYTYFGKTYYHDSTGWYESAGNDQWVRADLDDSFLNHSDKYLNDDYDGEQFDYYKYQPLPESETIDYFTEPTAPEYQTNKYGEEIVTNEFGEEFYPDEITFEDEELFE